VFAILVERERDDRARPPRPPKPIIDTDDGDDAKAAG
jgi:hypothetical protein